MTTELQLDAKARFAASDGWSVRPENMKNKLSRKPRCCQWREGWANNYYSAQFPCRIKPMFEVQQYGVTVAWVCPKHSIAVTQNGFQIR